MIYQMILRGCSPGVLHGEWGGENLVVRVDGSCAISAGSYVQFIGHRDNTGAIVCTKIVKYVAQSHESVGVCDRRYSWLLSQLRTVIGNAVEIRPPTIVRGIAEHSFVTNYEGKMARLTRSHALYCTLGAIKYGRCYSIGKVFRNEMNATTRHLREFDMLQFGALDMDVASCMEYVESMVRAIHVAALHQFHVGEISELTHERFSRMTWKELREMTAADIGDERVMDWENVINSNGSRTDPIFVTDIPLKFSSWSAKAQPDGLTSTFNLIFPKVGEVVEGSRRNTDIEDFRERFSGNRNLAINLRWYVDGLIYPKLPVSVFGMGVERLAMWLYDIPDIRMVRQYAG